jgi:hypothetical protein
MQLTTARLKQIIKEELEGITNEMVEEKGNTLNEDIANSEQVIQALSMGIGVLAASGSAAGTVTVLSGLLKDFLKKKGNNQPLKENMEVGQALLAAVSALVGIGASVGIIDTLKSLANNYSGKDKVEEAKKKAALAKQKMPAKRGSTGTFGTKNPQADQRFQKAGAVKKSK